VDLKSWHKACYDEGKDRSPGNRKRQTQEAKDRIMKPTMPILIACSTLLLGGCVFAPGGGGDYPGGDRSSDERPAVQPTLGQELIDLERARAAGAISQSEFDAAKARILASHN
jgi:hypothetical protein